MKPICDFCLSTSVKWSYPVESFDVPKYHFTSVGDWATCNKCSDVIENNDVVGLEKRSKDSIPEGCEFMEMEALDFIHLLHTGFWEHKLGGREPIEKDFEAVPTTVEFTN
jgi:hypothetical protein